MDGDFAVMLLGLKRDLRVEQEGVIYPQEVSQQTDHQLSFPIVLWLQFCGRNSAKRATRITGIDMQVR